MLKKIFIFNGIILLIGFISAFQRGYVYQKAKDNQIVESVSNEKQDLIDEEIITSLLSDKKEDKEETKELEIVVPEVKKEVSISKENTSQTKQEVQTPKTDNVEGKSSTPPEVVIPQPKQPTEWEKLGISEYDYYNSPEIAWKTVDFSISEFGNIENTKNACYNAGANYTGLENYRFRCDETYSYSGKFLGYHIQYIELES